MHLSRRELLRAAVATGVALAVPSWLDAGGIGGALSWNRRLVLVELNGGNDGLNTLVPWQDPTYISGRSSTRLSGSALTAFADGSGLRMNMNLVAGPGNGRFKRLWDDGRLGIALGVGMANQNLSHFRGMDIWNSGSDPATLVTTGWLQRSLAAAGALGSGIHAHGALIARPTSNPLAGPTMKAIAMNDARDFLNQSQDMPALPLAGSNALRHCLQVRADVAAVRADIASRFAYNESSGAVVNPSFTGDSGNALFPNGNFGDQCRATARLIVAGVGIPVYKLAIGGFDNHSSQLAKHNELLAQVAHGLTGLADALDGHGKLVDTLIMTYSEFGRRVEENGSAGTDHGTLAPHFLISHQTNFQGANRLHGSQPSLTDLDNRGDLKFTASSIDYRRLYATALTFLGMPTGVFDTTYAPLTNLLSA